VSGFEAGMSISVTGASARGAAASAFCSCGITGGDTIASSTAFW
jgi:hypothetical protein